MKTNQAVPKLFVSLPAGALSPALLEGWFICAQTQKIHTPRRPAPEGFGILCSHEDAQSFDPILWGTWEIQARAHSLRDSSSFANTGLIVFLAWPVNRFKCLKRHACFLVMTLLSGMVGRDPIPTTPCNRLFNTKQASYNIQTRLYLGIMFTTRCGFVYQRMR